MMPAMQLPSTMVTPPTFIKGSKKKLELVNKNSLKPTTGLAEWLRW
jgi:hypothetical protein